MLHFNVILAEEISKTLETRTLKELIDNRGAIQEFQNPMLILSVASMLLQVSVCLPVYEAGITSMSATSGETKEVSVLN